MLIMLLVALAADATPPASHQAKSLTDKQGNLSQFYGVPVDLTLSKLKRSGRRYFIGHESSEGEQYTNYTVHAPSGVSVKILFEDDGKLYMAETSSHNAIASRGIGVGSTLSEVKKAWPAGVLLYGIADGTFATFVTGSNVLLRFNPRDLPAQAFDVDWCKSRNIKVPDIRVQTISVFPKPNPVPKAANISCR